MIQERCQFRRELHLPVDEPTHSWGWLMVVVGLMATVIYLVMVTV